MAFLAKWDMRCEDKTSNLERTLSGTFYACFIRTPFRINHISVASSKDLKIFWCFILFHDFTLWGILHVISSNKFSSSRRDCKMSLKDVFKTLSKSPLASTSWGCLRRQKKCYTEDVFKTSSSCLQQVFTKTNICLDSALLSQESCIWQKVILK